ncbi:HK97 gp10 family phage protein [Brevibacillus formosus]|uniref:HK97 gp10 family phage protein n=1 Tax=Brevibacillus formosus TaxID=54913 RepID=UPI003F1DAA53
MAEFRFSNFDQFEQQFLTHLKETMPLVVEMKLYEIAYRLNAHIKRLTPVDTGRLKNSFTVGNLVKNGDEWYIEVGTNLEYSKHVEYGHRTRDHKGFVPGAHMVEISLRQLEQELPAEMREWMQGLMGALGQ